MDSLYQLLSSDTLYYEEQRIEEGENIHLSFRFRQTGIWFRYTFWLHYTADGRHALRQRVYLDFNSEDLEDENDLLVYQDHYLAFQVLQPFPNEVTALLPEGRLDQLYYLENILKKTCVDKMGPWSPADLPEFGIVTAHSTGLYGNELAKEIFDWQESRLYNRNHELYLGIEELTGMNSVFFLFYPIGDVQALYPTGTPWIQYSQFFKSKKAYSTEISTIDFMKNRSYLIALHQAHREYNHNGTMALEQVYLNGFLHGPSTTYFYEENKLNSLKIDHYSFGQVVNSTGYRKGKRAAKKGHRAYKKYCRKWKID